MTCWLRERKRARLGSSITSTVLYTRLHTVMCKVTIVTPHSYSSEGPFRLVVCPGVRSTNYSTVCRHAFS